MKRKWPLWNPEIGMWVLCDRPWFGLHGTTPTNADIWTIELNIGRFTFGANTGVHRSLEFWNGDKLYEWRRNKPDCNCYACHMTRPMSPAVARILAEHLADPNHPVRKLPPRDSRSED